MWLFVLAFCFLSLVIYVFLVLVRLLPQIIAGIVLLLVTVFVVEKISDAINFVESAATYGFNVVVNVVTYFFDNFWMIFGVMLGAVVAASLLWMIVPPAIQRARRQMRRYYNRRTMCLLDHEG